MADEVMDYKRLITDRFKIMILYGLLFLKLLSILPLFSVPVSILQFIWRYFFAGYLDAEYISSSVLMLVKDFRLAGVFGISIFIVLQIFIRSAVGCPLRSDRIPSMLWASCLL